MKLPVQRTRSLRFLEARPPRDVAVDQLADDAGGVETGLIDSLTMLELIAFLEAEFGLDL